MNRRWLAGRLPNPAEIRRRLGLVGGERGWRGRLAAALREPALWCPTRRSIAGGVAVGLFVSWMPVPLQMVLAAILASLVRVHVPVSVVMVWFTNPLTIAPLLYAAWRTGSILLGEPPREAPLPEGLEAVLAVIGDAWPAVLAGCAFLGVASAVSGFVATRVLWRVLAVRRWRSRRWRLRRGAAAPDGVAHASRGPRRAHAPPRHAGLDGVAIRPERTGAVTVPVRSPPGPRPRPRP